MKRPGKMAIAFINTIFSIMYEGGALAYVGSDPVPVIPQSCNFTTASAEFGPDGSIRYNVMGTCNGSPFTGQMAYGTNQQMQEKFFYRGAQISTTAMCPANPWISGARCEDHKVAAKGADPGSLLHSPVPLSLQVAGSAQVFQHAHANAARPKPPGPPIHAKATMRSMFTATVNWLGPEQQGPYGPYLNFVIEARPQKAEGAAWIKLGGVARHTAPEYKLTVKLPPAPVRGTGWELRACSTTVFTSTCTGPIIPTPVPMAEMLSPNLERAKKPSPKDLDVHSGLKLGKPPFGNTQTPESSQADPGRISSAKPKSFGKLPASSPETNASLNPQPLPPKALSSPTFKPKAFSGSILRRGISEEEKSSTDTTQTEASPTGK